MKVHLAKSIKKEWTRLIPSKLVPVLQRKNLKQLGWPKQAAARRSATTRLFERAAATTGLVTDVPKGRRSKWYVLVCVCV